MSATDPNAAAFREQLDKRFRFLLDELEPDEMRTFVQQAKAELGDGTVTNDEEALSEDLRNSTTSWHPIYSAQ
jgi:hypothetical protein